MKNTLKKWTLLIMAEILAVTILIGIMYTVYGNKVEKLESQINESTEYRPPATYVH